MSEASATRRLPRVFGTPMSAIATVSLLLVAVLAVAGPSLAPHDPLLFHAGNRLEGPSAAFWLGTDQFGRDILSRILAGAPASILFGLSATAIGVVAGTVFGVVSGYAGGRVDEVLMRILDAVIAIPNLLLVMLIITVLGSSTVNAVLAVGIAFAPGIARVARGSALSIRSRDFINAARARGENHGYIVMRELLPNVLPPIVIEASLRVAVAILVGATLSYLGLGAQPPASDWGLMIAEARAYLFRNVWLVIAPAAFIAFAAISFNLAGDALRDALNPRLGR